MLVGANPDQLDSVAEQLARAADRVRSMHVDVLRLVRTAAWGGRDADTFESAWRARGRATLESAADMLDTAAGTLRRNAADQRTTSAADSGAIGGGSGPVTGPGPGSGGGLLGQIDRMLDAVLGPEWRWAGEDGLRQARDLVGATPAEQAQWWASLSDEQRQAMLAYQPLALLPLAGLPADVHRRANHNAIQAAGRTIAVGSIENEVRAEATAFYVRLGADAHVDGRTFPDGHVELELGLGGELGAHVARGDTEGSLSLRGEAARTYSFESQAEADRFLRDLAGSLRPDSVGDGFRALGSVVGIGGGPAGYAWHEINEVFDRYESNYVNTTAGGSLRGEVSVEVPDVGEVSLDGGIGVERNFTEHTTTGYVEVGADGQLGFGPWRGAASGDARLEVTWDDDGQLRDLRVAGAYDLTTGAGYDVPEVFQSSVTAGAGGRFEATVDLTNPANRELAGELLLAQSRNDVVAAADAYARLMDASQVVVQPTAVARTEVQVGAEYGGFGVEAGYEGSATHALATYVKPPHGEFGRVNA